MSVSESNQIVPPDLPKHKAPASDLSPSVKAKPKLVGRAIAFFAITIFGAIADLWTKQAVFNWLGYPGQGDVYWVWEGYVGFQTAVNIGALFGIGAGLGSVFAGLSIVATIGILTWLFVYRAAESWWLTVAAGFILGGIFGNLYDRLGLWFEEGQGLPPEWKSGVRDWILLCYGNHTWPNFNIADSLLVCGTIMLAWRSFFPVPVDVEV